MDKYITVNCLRNPLTACEISLHRRDMIRARGKVVYNRMPFGRHRGRLLPDIPTNYLQWVLRECTEIDPTLRRAIQAELESRPWAGTLPGTSTPGGDGRSVVDVRSALKSWYREMALRYHPDRTLDNGTAMKAINAGYERLQELFGVTR